MRETSLCLQPIRQITSPAIISERSIYALRGAKSRSPIGETRTSLERNPLSAAKSDWTRGLGLLLGGVGC